MFYKKKSLGQNFLRNAGALRKIVDAGKIISDETVLEIGPGEGDLTKELISAGAKVVAVEKDSRLIPILEKKFSKEIKTGQLTIVHRDILEFNPSDFNLTANSYKLIANIPYYLTGEILRKALSKWPQPSKIVILVQKEVAQRIVACDGKESLFSMSVKIYGDPKIIGIVKAGSFVPSPKVDSAIISIENISKKHFQGESLNLKKGLPLNEKRFFEILKAGFAHKRKMISGNLKSVLENKTGEKLPLCKIAPSARAENLTLENWLCLATFGFEDSPRKN